MMLSTTRVTLMAHIYHARAMCQVGLNTMWINLYTLLSVSRRPVLLLSFWEKPDDLHFIDEETEALRGEET